MEKNKLDLLAEEVLSQLEIEETKLLSWGFLGGTFEAKTKIQEALDKPPTILIAKLWEELQGQGLKESDILQNLVQRKLIFVNGSRARTRYSETVRLLYLLKQRFSFEDWQSASNLVSNIKLLPKYRRYPQRNQDWEVVSAQLEKSGVNGSFKKEVFECLLDDGKIKLSTFQVESLEHLLKAVRSNRDGGTIVGAGTGSGKTKAFYLPAFATISETLRDDYSYWTKVLAIYPRTELLKDQFKEALTEADKLNDFMETNNLRGILIGGYYGETPPRAEDVENSPFYKWEKSDRGYICPFLTCPACNSDLVWTFGELEQEIEKNRSQTYGTHENLHCSKCDTVISNKNIVLTRSRMKLSPPDILFTTTEMLNRKLFSIDDQYIFGLQDRKAPQFVLLDEVHIYNGVTGAHVAYVLRRWRNLVKFHSKGKPIQFVGLSATLTNPQFFFSNLVGVAENKTRYICPTEEDLTEEGIEYNAILRGDPISVTALLSTSVQTAMLMGRMLDPLGFEVSKGAWGSKIFGFTDKLDLINRWYHIERDAETYKILSQFRDRNEVHPSTLPMQNKMGQVWGCAENINPKGVKTPLRIGITSSQFKGVDPKARLVVATSTLEVGFNDPEVGAVIQHKAPRNIASFLQRKGRAGRVRGMRPWTIVVTSAYGRDRWVYENPEQLFDPLLPELTLPIRNSYVQQIQASYALMDWMALNLSKRGYKDANLWNILSPKNIGKFNQEKTVIYELLVQVLTGNYSDLEKFIQDSLQLNGSIMGRIMWSPPRSIMFHLVPSLANYLKTDWQQFVESNRITKKPINQYLDQNVPLSGYVPKNLFSNLEVNDIQIEVTDRKRETIDLRQGMFEFAPGNVSKRYVNVESIHDAHWVPITLDDHTLNLNGNNNIKVRHIDIVEGGVSVYLPQHYKLERIPNEITDRSTSILQWQVDIRPDGNDISGPLEGKKINLIKGSVLEDIIESVDYFSNDNNQWVLFTRYAKELFAEIRNIRGESMRNKIKIKFDQEDVALGFQNYVDAIAIKYKNINVKQLTQNTNWFHIVTQLRPTFYQNQMQGDKYLKECLSSFEIDWLCQVCLSSTIAIGVSKEVTIAKAVEIYRVNLEKISDRTLRAIFKTVAASANSKENEDAKLHKRLLGHINTPSIMNKFLDGMVLLYADLTNKEEFWTWIQERSISTVAAAFKLAVDELLADVNTEDLLVDIKGGYIWLSEPESGGMGIINNLASTIQNYPRKFEELMIHAINHCKRHELSRALNTVLVNIDDSKMSAVFKKVRMANTIDDQKDALEDLQKTLTKQGITPKRELIVSIVTKLLNGNSNEDTDRLVKILSERWRSEEERLHCTIDSRVFTVACLKIDEIREVTDKILERVNPESKSEIEENQRFALIETLLWSACLNSCPDCLQIYNPYASFHEPSRSILSNLLRPNHKLIMYEEPDWKDKVEQALRQGHKVRVQVGYEDIGTCRQELLTVIQTPTDIGFELLYSYIEGVYNSGSQWFFDLSIREVLHA